MTKNHNRVNNNNKTEKERQKIHFFKMFFTRYTIWGLLCILISIVINLSNFYDNLILIIIQNIFSSVGTAILVGAIFDFSKNSEAFTIFVSNILKDIVISKEFLNIMSKEEKKNSLELLLKPTNLQIEQCSSIELYYKKSIDKFMELYNMPFKTDLIINIKIQKEDGKLVAKGDLTHRIYKVNGQFQPIITTFEKENCKISESFIILPDGKKIKLENESVKETNDINEIAENGEIAKKYETKIPTEYCDHTFLTVCREFSEIGHDHWINFHWTSLTICDGIYFKMICDKGITVKDYLVFDNKMCYDIEENNDKNIIKIISTNWLDSYSGFTITASDT